MRIVAALGGNALLRRGEPMTVENQRANVRLACEALAPLAMHHDLVVLHGNGPQVGLLALQGAAYRQVETYPLDVLDAQTEGMIGYLIEQELGNLLPPDRRLATLLTMIEVDPTDPAFGDPTKPIGPVYDAEEAARLAAQKGWVMRPDGNGMRRVVPSPRPQQVVEIEPIRWLLERGCVVVCTGGGGIPVALTDEEVPAGRRLVGVEAVIDKDRAGALLARSLDADVLIMLTDVDAVVDGWGTPEARRLRRVHPDALDPAAFASGSMGPKVEAASTFARETGHPAVIGSLVRADALVTGQAGTTIAVDVTATAWWP